MALSIEELQTRVDAYRAHNNNMTATARELGLDRETLRDNLKRAARLGLMLDHAPAMPGFEITKVAETRSGKFVTQKPEHGNVFEMPATHQLGNVTMHLDAKGRTVQSWPRLMPDDATRKAAMEASMAAMKETLPRAKPVILNTQKEYNEALLNQYTITDMHMGSLSWRDETGADYDLKIAEKLLLDWFAMAIKLAPDAERAVFAQIGDLLHYDSLLAVTPAHGNILDSDSRFQKIVRVVIRTMRTIIQILLEKHKQVHLIMADANHDEASSAWLREMFAAFYDHEPRITVENSANTYYAVEHGQTCLFYHHGHKKKIDELDRTFAGAFRELFGRTKYAYAHTGHLHTDELKSTNLMKVERHETLAAKDAHAAKGGYLSGRSAKVITYHKQYGEVSRIILTPEMVAQDDIAPQARAHRGAL